MCYFRNRVLGLLLPVAAGFLSCSALLCAEEDSAASSSGDSLVRASARKLERVGTLTASLRQVVRADDQEFHSTGVLQWAPGNRFRLEIEQPLDEAVARRLYVVNPEVGYRYEHVLQKETLERFAMDSIVPLLHAKVQERKTRREISAYLPFARPSEMLYGYLETTEFTEVESKTFGKSKPRKVHVALGQWRKNVLSELVLSADSALDELPTHVPQFTRLYLDDETGWPIRIELFRREQGEEQLPTFVLEFTDLHIGGDLAEDVFHFTPPSHLEAEDVTTMLVEKLQQLPDKPPVRAAVGN